MFHLRSPHFPVHIVFSKFCFSQLADFFKRRDTLLSLVDRTAYESQKSRLIQDFSAFLAVNSSLDGPLSTSSSVQVASPDDVCKFLFSRDGRGRTQVHHSGCEHLGAHGKRPCGCPLHLAAGTIDSVIGKLRAHFNSIGRCNPHRPGDFSSNPCASPEVKRWLKAASVEQRRAHVTPRQAPPIFSTHLRLLVSEISRLISLLSPSARFLPDTFILYRDLAFFLIQWFVGDRAGDLSQAVGKEITRLACGSLLLNHTMGKTVRQSDGDLLVIPSVPEEPLLCPVRALDAYVDLCRMNGVDVVNTFLFRPTKPPRHDSISSKAFSSCNATKRLRVYLSEEVLPDASSFTAHGSRAGCAITLLLLGATSDDVKGHCRWASDRVFKHYTDLHRVSRLTGSAALLRDGVTTDSTGASLADDAAAFYASLDSGIGQSRAFL